MLQKIRSAMQFENESKLSGIFEVDEYHAGGSLKNMHYGKKLEATRITWKDIRNGKYRQSDRNQKRAA